MNQTSDQRGALDAFYEHLACLLPQTTNLGESDDEQDLYVLLGAAIEATRQSQPPLLCAQRCTHCCRGPGGVLKLITALEWLPMMRVAVALPEAVQRAIIRQTYEQFAPMLASMVSPPTAGPPLTLDMTAHCPFLHHETCSIYEGRPLACRAMGETAVYSPHGAAPFACDLAIEHIATAMPDGTCLPTINPYLDRLGQLVQGIRIEAHIPLWIVAHAENGRFRYDLQWRPDFAAAIQRFLREMGARPKTDS